MTDSKIKSPVDASELKKRLTDEQFQVTQCSATERAFTGIYWNHKGDGVYNCVVCDSPLFSSTSKFESGSGWPSFFSPVSKESIVEKEDRAYGMVRIEIQCANCHAHLGHVFPDGPKPTGLRYCVNSASLDFDEKAEK